MKVLGYVLLVGLCIGGNAFTEDSKKTSFTSAEMNAITNYAILDLDRVYKSIPENKVIRVKFNNVDAVKALDNGKNFWVNLSDDSGNRVPVIVDAEGSEYFNRKNKQRDRKQKNGDYSDAARRFLYCTVAESELQNKLGGSWSGPVLTAIGVDTKTGSGGKTTIGW